MSTASTSVDSSWAGGPRAAERLLVLLACPEDEASRLRADWVGQAVDVEHLTDLGAVLYVAGRVAPDAIVIGTIGDGLLPKEFLGALRQVNAQIPVIVGAEGDPRDSQALSAAGATAVLPMPLSAGSLLAAIEASLADGSAFRTRPMALDLGRLRIDGAGPRIWIDDVQFVIPPMEFLLLRYLAERPGQIISRAELVSAAWHEPVAQHSNSLSVHVARLRRRFCRIAGEAWIRPVRGFGYQLTVSAPAVIGGAEPARRLRRTGSK